LATKDLCFWHSTASLQFLLRTGLLSTLQSNAGKIAVHWDLAPDRLHELRETYKPIIVRGDFGKHGYSSFLWGIVVNLQAYGTSTRRYIASAKEDMWNQIDTRT
jgi:hypothetical protein